MENQLIFANKWLFFRGKNRQRQEAVSILSAKEFTYENKYKKQKATALIIANNQLRMLKEEKQKQTAELATANEELAYQEVEKENRAAELIVINKNFALQKDENEKENEKLRAANKELEQFVYLTVHDLQQPLRTVSGYIKIIKEDYLHLLDSKARQYLKAIINSAKRMGILLHSLLDYSRVGRNKKLTQANCNTLVAEAIADLAALIKASKAIVEVAEMPALKINEMEIRQVFQNLITNAIKFQRKDSQPKIKISAAETGKYWQFSVSDNGIGIDSIHFEKVFDIFKRLHTTAEFEGHGVGLANCKKIIELHQGKIWVESTAAGSTFHFTLPKID